MALTGAFTQGLAAGAQAAYAGKLKEKMDRDMALSDQAMAEKQAEIDKSKAEVNKGKLKPSSLMQNDPEMAAAKSAIPVATSTPSVAPQNIGNEDEKLAEGYVKDERGNLVFRSSKSLKAGKRPINAKAAIKAVKTGVKKC